MSAGERLATMRLGGSARPRPENAAPHPLLALGHRLVRQADHGEVHGAAGQLHLDVDAARLDAFEGHGDHRPSQTRKTPFYPKTYPHLSTAAGPDQEQIRNNPRGCGESVT